MLLVMSLVNLTFSAINISHYENMSMQYSTIIHGCKHHNFQLKNYDIFLIFAQNIDCGYTVGQGSEAVLTSTHNLCYRAKIRK